MLDWWDRHERALFIIVVIGFWYFLLNAGIEAVLGTEVPGSGIC
jgi:hypothetical protein